MFEVVCKYLSVNVFNSRIITKAKFKLRARIQNDRVVIRGNLNGKTHSYYLPHANSFYNAPVAAVTKGAGSNALLA